MAYLLSCLLISALAVTDLTLEPASGQSGPLVYPKALPAFQKPHIRFAKPVAYDSGGRYAYSVAAADLNGDGKPDLVVANACVSGSSCAGEAVVLLGNGDGTFQQAVSYGTGAYYAESVVVGDVNGDRTPDVVVSSDCLTVDHNGTCTSTGVVSVLLGNGDGTFQTAMTYNAGTYGAYSIAMSDLMGRGILDLVVVDDCRDGCTSGIVSVLLGNGDGTFQPAATYASGAEHAESVAVADVNGDKIPDLIVANLCSFNGGCGYSDGEVGVLLGNGDGTFQPAIVYDSGSTYANSVAVGDLRGNGIQDLIVANGYYNNIVSVLLGNGDSTFQAPTTYVLDGILSDAVTIGDVNGDGIPDLAVTDGCVKVRNGACVGDATVSVLLGNGDGTFQGPTVYSSDGSGASAIAIADLDGDGRPDLIATNAWHNDYNDEGLVAVLLNETTYSSKTALSASPNPAHVNQAVTLTATIASTPPAQDGEVVTFFNGKTSLGTGTTRNAVASLTTSFSKAKSYTIKADYPGDAFRKKSSGTVKVVVNP